MIILIIIIRRRILIVMRTAILTVITVIIMAINAKIRIDSSIAITIVSSRSTMIIIGIYAHAYAVYT